MKEEEAQIDELINAKARRGAGFSSALTTVISPASKGRPYKDQEQSSMRLEQLGLR